MTAFRDYRPAIEAGAQQPGRRVAGGGEATRIRTAFGWIVAKSWDRDEIRLLRRAARAALL